MQAIAELASNFLLVVMAGMGLLAVLWLCYGVVWAVKKLLRSHDCGKAAK